MKRSYVQQAGVPLEPRRDLRTDFTAYTLRSANRAKHRANRKHNLQQLLGENFTMKSIKFVRTAPGAALTAAVIATSSVGAYALANNWFGTSVQTQTSGSTVTVSANDCPASLLQAYQDGNAKDTYNIATTYKITKPDVIAPADIEADQLVTCEERAVTDVAKQAFPADYDGTNYQATGYYNDLYFPNGKYGTVQSVKGNTVIIQDIPGAPGGDRLTATVTIPADAKVLVGGKPSSLADFKSGDQVYVSFQDSTAQKEAYKDGNLSSTSVVRAIAKTQYDYSAKDKMFMAANKAAFRIEKTSDAIGG